MHADNPLWRGRGEILLVRAVVEVQASIGDHYMFYENFVKMGDKLIGR